SGAPAPTYPWRVRERIPLSGIRKIIGQRLKQSQNNAVALTLTREVQATNLVSARRETKESGGGSIPIDAFFVKSLAAALRERPELNAIIDDDELLLLDEINIGFAVALPNGLNVPVIRGADGLKIGEIAEHMRYLADVARKGELKSG